MPYGHYAEVPMEDPDGSGALPIHVGPEVLLPEPRGRRERQRSGL